MIECNSLELGKCCGECVLCGVGVPNVAGVVRMINGQSYIQAFQSATRLQIRKRIYYAFGGVKHPV